MRKDSVNPKITNKLSHNILVQSLRDYLDFPDGILGKGVFSLSDFSMGIGNRNGHADVVTINTSYSNSLFTVYEVKSSKSDFRADINKGKYLKYLEVCNRLFFAAPKGIITKNDLPDGIGLMTYDPEKGWRTTKGATVKQMEIPNDVLIKFIWANNRKRLEIRDLSRKRIMKENQTLRERAWNIGHEIAEAVENRDDVLWKKQYDRLKEDQDEIVEKIKESLGIKYFYIDTVCEQIKKLKETGSVFNWEERQQIKNILIKLN